MTTRTPDLRNCCLGAGRRCTLQKRGQHELSKASDIARLKITLDYVEPKVMRRIDVPFGIKLDRLHLVIQAAMGWTNSHLWGFEAGGANWAPT